MRWRCSTIPDMSEGDTNGRVVEQIVGQSANSEKIIPDDLLPTVDYWKLYLQEPDCLFPSRPYNFNLLPLVIKDKHACMPTAINVLMGRLIFKNLRQFMEAQKFSKKVFRFNYYKYIFLNKLFFRNQLCAMATSSCGRMVSAVLG